MENVVHINYWYYLFLPLISRLLSQKQPNQKAYLDSIWVQHFHNIRLVPPVYKCIH